MRLGPRCVAEGIGTFVLVFIGCGSALVSAAFPAVGIGLLGVAFAFGLSVLTMVFAIGHISGGHLNPAVTVGLAVGGRFPGREVLAYICSQVIGATLGAWVLFGVVSGKPGFDLARGFATNGYDLHSPGGYALGACLLAEIVLTCFFVMVVLGATDRRAPQGFAAIAIGLALTMVHLVGLPITNMSANPARSTGPAIIAGGWALGQLWLFWLAPLIGGFLAGIIYPGVARQAVLETPIVAPQRAA